MSIKSIPRITLGSHFSYRDLPAKVTSNTLYNVYVLDETGNSIYETIETNIINVTEEDIKNKNFYKFPDANIHREKINILKNKFNISIKRNFENVDYIIINSNNLKKCSRIPYSACYKQDIINNNFLNSAQLKDIIDNCTSEIVFISHIGSDIYPLYKDLVINKKFYDISKLNISENSINETNIDFLYKKKLILDTNLEQISTEDNKILNIEDYYLLVQMLSTKTDCNLALEILANCNFEKSKHIIYCIFFLYENIIKENSTNYNLVNIKTLRNKINNFSFARYYYNFGKTLTLAKNLKQNDLLNEEAVELVKKLVHQEVVEILSGDIITVENFSFKIYGQ